MISPNPDLIRIGLKAAHLKGFSHCVYIHGGNHARYPALFCNDELIAEEFIRLALDRLPQIAALYIQLEHDRISPVMLETLCEELKNAAEKNIEAREADRRVYDAKQ